MVIDVPEDKINQNADYALTEKDVLDWESKYGQIPAKSMVCMRTGWSKRFHDVKAYYNDSHFPGFGIDAVELLIKRNVRSIAIDTGSLDIGGTTDCPVHTRWLRLDKYQIENCNFEGLPAKDFTIIAMPGCSKMAIKRCLWTCGLTTSRA